MRLATATGLGLALIVGMGVVGCGGGGGGGAPAAPAPPPPPPPAPGPAASAVQGSVTGGEPVVGAQVAFVSAWAAEGIESVQPLEDLARTTEVAATTDREGSFSITVDPGPYYVVVIPAAGDEKHLPGGTFAQGHSIWLSEGATTILNIELSERPPAGAEYVGSSRCLECHVGHAETRGTLHFLGFRAVTADGPQASGLQDLSDLPDANAGLGFFVDGNPQDNTGAGDDYGYLRDTGAGYQVLLGKDDTGYFEAFTDGALISQRYYVLFTYGGEGLYKQRYVTRVDAGGAYTDDPSAGSYYILPTQYNETSGDPRRGGEVTTPGWGNYHADRWGAPLEDGGPAGVVPAQSKSLDNNCAGCHFTGLTLAQDAEGNFHADAVDDPGGAVDLDGDGVPEDINIGCERCHGPGSEHAKYAKGWIIEPSRLPVGRANQICGQCHVRGHGKGTVGGVETEYASRGQDGAIEFTRAGMSPAEFYGTADGTGILPNFGTDNAEAFYVPVGYASGSASWQDRSGGFGSEIDHSAKHHQQYFDLQHSKHGHNPWEILACFSCHDPHAREREAQLAEEHENNVLCLSCHATHGAFENVSDDDVDLVRGGGPAPAGLKEAIAEHIRDETFDMVGVAMNLGSDAYANPTSFSAMGRCTTCHMPKTAKSAQWITDGDGFVIEGDIASHTFDPISPDTSAAMAEAGKKPVPDSCVFCHRGLFLGAYPDYRVAPRPAQ